MVAIWGDEEGRGEGDSGIIIESRDHHNDRPIGKKILTYYAERVSGRGPTSLCVDQD